MRPLVGDAEAAALVLQACVLDDGRGVSISITSENDADVNIVGHERETLDRNWIRIDDMTIRDDVPIG